MSKSIKLNNDIYIDSSGIITNIENEKIYETIEVLNGRRVYGYDYIFSQPLIANTDYVFDLPFANLIDVAWVDLGNSYIENSKATSAYNIWCLGSVSGFQFRIGINTISKLSIRADSAWNNMWTFHIRIKFTKK